MAFFHSSGQFLVLVGLLYVYLSIRYTYTHKIYIHIPIYVHMQNQYKLFTGGTSYVPKP